MAEDGAGRTVPGPVAGLHLVSVPIGSARDITLRALDVLSGADVLAAEDTRSLRRLMEIHGLAVGDRPLWSYHDHNGAAVRPRIVEALRAGRSVAYASEAGTPLVADPGWRLVEAARAEDLPVHAVPGASAALAALVVGGLPTDRFLFAGFPPSKTVARQRFFRELGAVSATLVIYESPKRAAAALRDAAAALGARPARLCRELTKRFEEVWAGDLPALAARAEAAPPKGEIVILIGHVAADGATDADLETLLLQRMGTESLTAAVRHVSGETGTKRKRVYDLALRLKGDG